MQILSQLIPERLSEFQWTIAKLVDLGVNEMWLQDANPTPGQARELLKGILYLKEWCRYNNPT